MLLLVASEIADGAIARPVAVAVVAVEEEEEEEWLLLRSWVVYLRPACHGSGARGEAWILEVLRISFSVRPTG